jgi:thioredoxin 1
MKTIQFFITLLLLFFQSINISICQNISDNNTGIKLSATAFYKNIISDKFSQVIDVRTPQEFSEGYIANAINVNWNDNSFDTEVLKFNKNKPVYIYCLAGGRSANAAIKLTELGFKTVFDLKGGINAWRNANLPLKILDNISHPDKKGMNIVDFNNKINQKGLVLVDVFAPWCGPCKKMAPYLEEIAIERKNKLTFIKINNDDNQEIVRFLYVDELPTLILYKNGKRVYNNIGLISKDDLLKVIDANLKN